MNNEKFLRNAKSAILRDIRKALPGTGELEITVRSNGDAEYFEQALKDPEIQNALRQKRLTARLRIDMFFVIKQSIVKQYILKNLKSIREGDPRTITFQVLKQDAGLHYAAFKMPEIQREIKHKKLDVKIQIIDKSGKIEPDIVIATLGDVKRLE